MSGGEGDGDGGGPPGRPLLPAHAVLDRLYRAERERLYAYLWAHTRDREDALDLLQEVFLRAWRHAAALAEMPPGRRPFWLFAIARRLCVDRHRHAAAARPAREAWRLAPSETAPAQAADPPGAAAEAAEARRLLDRAIRSLPAPLREVLALSVLGGATSGENGALLGLPAATVRYRLMRARGILRRALAATGYLRGRQEGTGG